MSSFASSDQGVLAETEAGAHGSDLGETAIGCFVDEVEEEAV